MSRDLYGAQEVNGLENPAEFHAEFTHKIKETVYWSDPRLAKIVRLRLLSDLGLDFWDVSYCYGVLKDGSPVEVQLPFSQLGRGRRYKGLMPQIVEFAKADKVYAKGLGIELAISTLV